MTFPYPSEGEPGVLTDPKAEARFLRSLMDQRKRVQDTLEELPLSPSPSWFYEAPHRTIFGAIRELQHEGSPTDMASVITKLRSQKLLEAVGGEAHLIHINHEVSASVGGRIKSDMGVLRELAVRRRLRRAGAGVEQLSEDTSIPLKEALSLSERGIQEAGEEDSVHEVHDLKKLAVEEVRELEKPKEKQHVGHSSDFTRLNFVLGGFRRGNLVIIASRPAQGKTTFSLNLAFQVAYNSRLPAVFFSLEMDKQEILHRILASEGTRLGSALSPVVRLDRHRLEMASMGDKLKREEWELLINNRVLERDDSLFIVDDPKSTVFEMKAQARRIMRRHGGLSMVVVDYLQLVKGSDHNPSRKRYEAVGEISRELKIMAKDLKCTVVAVSQLSREIEKRDDDRPRLSDLRESGSIEQDADSCLFIHSPKKKFGDDLMPHVTTMVEKNRHGPTGSVKMVFDKRAQMFVEV